VFTNLQIETLEPLIILTIPRYSQWASVIPWVCCIWAAWLPVDQQGYRKLFVAISHETIHVALWQQTGNIHIALDYYMHHSFACILDQDDGNFWCPTRAKLSRNSFKLFLTCLPLTLPIYFLLSNPALQSSRKHLQNAPSLKAKLACMLVDENKKKMLESQKSDIAWMVEK